MVSNVFAFQWNSNRCIPPHSFWLISFHTDHLFCGKRERRAPQLISSFFSFFFFFLNKALNWEWIYVGYNTQVDNTSVKLNEARFYSPRSYQWNSGFQPMVGIHNDIYSVHLYPRSDQWRRWSSSISARDLQSGSANQSQHLILICDGRNELIYDSAVNKFVCVCFFTSKHGSLKRRTLQTETTAKFYKWKLKSKKDEQQHANKTRQTEQKQKRECQILDRNVDYFYLKEEALEKRGDEDNNGHINNHISLSWHQLINTSSDPSTRTGAPPFAALQSSEWQRALEQFQYQTRQSHF